MILFAIPILEYIFLDPYSSGVLLVLQFTFSPITALVFLILCGVYAIRHKKVKFMFPALIFLVIILLGIAHHYSNPINSPIFGDAFYW